MSLFQKLKETLEEKATLKKQQEEKDRETIRNSPYAKATVEFIVKELDKDAFRKCYFNSEYPYHCIKLEVDRSCIAFSTFRKTANGTEREYVWGVGFEAAGMAELNSWAAANELKEMILEAIAASGKARVDNGYLYAPAPKEW